MQMNDDQLEMCLRNLKSSSREPDTIDNNLEERMMGLSSKIKMSRRRTKRIITVMALVLLSGTGFVALGGDSVVMNYIAPSHEKDTEGNPIPSDFSLGKWLHKIHDHVWEHFKSRHGN